MFMPDEDPRRLLERSLSDLFAFQCVLSSLRAVRHEDSEEMLWQSFLASLVEQYGLEFAWYGRLQDGWITPVSQSGAEERELGELELSVGSQDAISRACQTQSPICCGNRLVLPIVTDGAVDGALTVAAPPGQTFGADRVDQLRHLTADAAGMLGERRSRNRVEQALRESEERFRRLVENTVDGVWQIDLRNCITYVSPRIETLFGVAPAEVLGKPLEEILPGAPAQQLIAALRDGPVVALPFPLTLPDGRQLTIEVSAGPLSDRRGKVRGYAGVFRDVTEKVRHERELEEARRQADLANRAKSLFLANMSHEIRTPMTGVVGMAMLLADTPLSGEQRGYVEAIRTSGEALRSLIDDILDFSKIEAGRLELESIQFNLRSCVERALELLAPKAGEKGLDLAYRLRPGIPESVTADPNRLRQVIVNLAGNAVKFTDRGSVVVDVESRDLGSQRYEIHFQVRDTGIGIPPERLDRLFVSFSQVDPSTSRRYGGTGLGLAISQRLCEKMGGRMWVESTPGSGSVFHFTIQVPGHVGAVPEFVSPAPALAGRRFLIVVEQPVTRELLADLAARWGMSPIAFSRPTEALAWAAAGNVCDAAILDHHLPGMEGELLARQLRRPHTWAGVAVLMLVPPGKRPSQDSSVSGSISRPVKPAQLFELLTSLLGQTPCAEAPPSEPQFDASFAGRHPLRILVAEDNLINQRVVLHALRRLGYEPAVAGNGREALDSVLAGAFDVVLMDVQMPLMDGLEATRAIRSQAAPERQPRIIAMTAAAYDEDRELCLAAGMDGYISKPLNLSELMDALQA